MCVWTLFFGRLAPGSRGFLLGGVDDFGGTPKKNWRDQAFDEKICLSDFDLSLKTRWQGKCAAGFHAKLVNIMASQPTPM